MNAWLSRWSAPIAVLVVSAVVLVTIRAAWPVAMVIGAVELFLAWWVSPLRTGPTIANDEARQRASSDGAVVIYWRPGCLFCSRLRRSLGSLGRQAMWVNIWADKDAAAAVRAVNDGNETVPTVLVGTEAVWTNPPPDRVRDALLRRATP